MRTVENATISSVVIKADTRLITPYCAPINVRGNKIINAMIVDFSDRSARPMLASTLQRPLLHLHIVSDSVIRL
ncbi:hypothetical protein [Nitrosospira briensis]|uniref:hypothetical protein n=1 Tax=Nitrosospira briensis TaxID=35799 RepID=UPI001C433124|nr:hypothetical protein [Nitrosospira briensis]